MKLRTTTSASKSRAPRIIKGVSLAVLMAVASVTSIQFATPVNADPYDAKIQALEKDIERYNAEAAKLSKQANSLERQVAKLTKEKETIQAQVRISQAKYDKLKQQIAETEEQIKENQDGLGTTLADLYVDNEVSPLELLASSENISDFLNKQEYRNAVRDQLSNTIKTVKELKEQLSQQKADVEKVLKDQKAQEKVLAEKEAERANLLAETRGSEDRYRSLSRKADKEKDQLQREQQMAIEAALRAAGGGGTAVAGDPNKGGYPSYLANSNYYNPIVDPWGMYSRQCVSYTAWKVFQKNGYMPYWGGRGNANQWPANARAAGITVSTTPRARSVGVIMSGTYGHVVWVEGVNSDGTINISQYNYYNAGGAGWGHYSEMYNLSPRSYDVYIYF